MREHSANGNGRQDPLASEALLYASGKLDGVQSALFEDRLAGDQAAREALSHAVSFTESSGVPSRPSPAYRDTVRKRLIRRSSLWQRLWGGNGFRGHPVLWGTVGAAAAALLMACFYQPDCRRAEHHRAGKPAAGAARHIVAADAGPFSAHDVRCKRVER